MKALWAALAVLVAAPAVTADQPGSAVLVLDAASATTRGRYRRRYVHELRAARDALGKMAAPGGALLAVRAMGGKRRGGCRSTRGLIRFQRTTAHSLWEGGLGVHPRGPRAVAAALDDAADDLDRGRRPRTVVLLAAGPDECGGDPCEEASELRQDGAIDLVRVIALNRRAARRLACLGPVSVARTGRALARGLFEALRAAFAPARLVVTATSAGRPSGGADVEVYAPGDDVPLARVESGTALALAAGRYDVRVSDDLAAGPRVAWKRGVLLAAAARTALQVPLGKGPATVLVHVRLNGRAAPTGTRVFLFRPGRRTYSVADGFPDETFTTPPGTYDVRAEIPATLGDIVVWKPAVEFVGGKTVEIQLDAVQELGLVRARAVSGRDALPFTVVSVLPNRSRGDSDADIDAGRDARLPVGVYTLTAQYDTPLGTLRGFVDDVVVEASGVAKATVDVGPTAKIRIDLDGPQPPGGTIAFTRAGHRRVLGWVDLGEPWRLPVGCYDLYDGARRLAKHVVLSPGENQHLVLHVR